jgi:hypothetical protein
MKKLVLPIMILLFILHQDSLVFGILPATLAYHMLFTVLAALAWVMVVKYAWPQFPEEDDEEGSES